MTNPRKLFLPNTVVFVTFRTEEGLPLVPLKFINKIIKSALGRAYELYQVEVVAVTFESNHCHLIIRVTNPELVSPFVGYVKQEIAHALNRLIGRPRKTVWIEGFDSPTILDSYTALKKIAYVLLNPVKDKLVSQMDQYPGVSSYQWLQTNQNKITTERIFRDSVIRLKNPEKPWLEEHSYQFEDEKKSEVTLELFPYAWKKCFPDTKDLSDTEIRSLMLEFLKEEESQLPSEPLDPERLKRQSLVKEYTSRKFGKRMVCLSIFSAQRKRFIKLYKYLCNQAMEAYEQWKKGNLIPFPLGLFPPCLPRMANILPSAYGF